MPLPRSTPLDAVTSNDSKVGNIQQSTENLLDVITSTNSGQGGIQQSSEKLDRSSMPLPPMPLDAITSTNSGQGGIQQSSDKLDRSSMLLPPAPLDAVTTSNSKNLPTSIAPVEVEGDISSEDKNMNNGTTDDTCLEEYSSSSDGYERIDLLDFPEKRWSPCHLLPKTQQPL